MKHTQVFIVIVSVAFFVSACGVKGKPLPPLKKSETSNQNQGTQSP